MVTVKRKSCQNNRCPAEIRSESFLHMHMHVVAASAVYCVPSRQEGDETPQRCPGSSDRQGTCDTGAYCTEACKLRVYSVFFFRI
jgi:hypothetical protein